MTEREQDKFKALLLAKEGELAKALHNRDGIAIEHNADEIDEILQATARDLAIARLHRESRLLRDVRAALRSISDGSYGICVRCEENISQRRLEAVPWTPFCVRCQEAMDCAEGPMIDVSGQVLVTAMRSVRREVA